MAFSNYTPSATWHSTIPVPDDAAIATGISAFSTPLEALADNIAFVSEYEIRVKDVVYATQNGTSAQFFCDSGTSTAYQDTGTAISVDVADGDRVLVDCSFDFAVGNPGTHYVRLAHNQGGATELSGTEKLCGTLTSRIPYTLAGVFNSNGSGSVDIFLQAKAATGDFSIYAGITLRAIILVKASAW